MKFLMLLVLIVAGGDALVADASSNSDSFVRRPGPVVINNVPSVYRHYHRVFRVNTGFYGYHILVNGNWYWPGNRHIRPIWWRPYGVSYFNYYRNLPRYRSFGAISYSPSTGRYGVAWGKANRFVAASSANSYCSSSDCAPVVWTQGGCASIAVDSDSKKVSWGLFSHRRGAVRNAMNSCERNRSEGASCQDIAWVCSY